MTILSRISKWFKKTKPKKTWVTPMENTPRHGSRRLKTTARKGVAIYEKIKTPDSPSTRHNGRAKGKAEAAKAKRSKK
jgi:hypothetical protein